MKTAEEIAFMYPATGGKMNVSDVYKAMEAYASQLSQQPTEKTAEWQLCPLCNGSRKLPSVSTTNPYKTCDMCNGEGKLIKSTLQSDSVDEEKAFEEWWKDFLEFPSNKPAFKKAFMAGLSSKVKPVNENTINQLYKLQLQVNCLVTKFTKEEDRPILENVQKILLPIIESALSPPKV